MGSPARRDALAWAEHLRETRSFVANGLAEGSLSLAELLDARNLPGLGEIHLLSVLEALPGARKVDTRRALQELAVGERIALWDLTDDQLEAVRARFGAAEHRERAVSEPSPPEPEHDTLVIVVSGPGGVGKGTVVDELRRRDPTLFLNVSWTTRAPRPGESADSYRFATREEFERHIAEGGFLEWVEFLDYLQGSPVPDPPAGDDVLFEIDVAGGAKLKEMFADALLIFIDAPDRSVQEQRLRGRGDDEVRIRQRVAHAEEELARAIELDYRVVVNDDLEVAVRRVQELIAEARSARVVG